MGRPPGVSGEALERLLVDAVEDYAIFALDPDGRVASWNEGARRIKGYAAAEILGKPYATFFTAEDTARGLPAQILERAAREGRVEEEGWRLRKDGSRFWADAVITALRDEQGELIGFAKVTRDLTERRRAEAQARRLERAQAARRAAESALRATELLAQAGSLVSSSLDYEETLRNVAAMAVPGFADFCALDLASGPELSRVAVEHADPARLRLARALGAGRPERTAAWQRGDVEYLPYIPAAAQTPPDSALHILAVVGVHAAVVAPLSAHGQHFGALTFGQTDPARGFSPADVTLARDLALRAAAAIENARLVRDLEDTRSELEAQATELEEQTHDLRQLTSALATQVQEAEAARAAAEAANGAKSRFLGAMSHELRTPLNAIAGYADLLDLGVYQPLTEAQRQALGRIQRNEERLISLIDGIIGYARLEAGKVIVRRQPLAVEDLLAGVQELQAVRATAAGLDFRRLSAGGVVVLGDPDKTERILLNLTENAIQFTEPGGFVEVGAYVQGERVAVFVRDSGRGIPASSLAEIFEPFVQLSREHTRESEGLGLGLAVSRELAHGMDGEIEAESEPGRGSTFTLLLPRAPAVEAVA